MITLTPRELVMLGLISGLCALLFFLAAAACAWGLYHGVGLLTDWRQARRDRRHDLETCRAINALDYPDHPQH